MPPFTEPSTPTACAASARAMSDQGLDVLIVSDPANMAYLTGYDGWSFYTPQGVAVGLDVDPVLFTRLMDAERRPRHDLPRRRRDPRLPRPLRAGPRPAPAGLGGGELQKRGLGRGRIGVESDAYYFTPRAYHALEAGLAAARWSTPPSS